MTSEQISSPDKEIKPCEPSDCRWIEGRVTAANEIDQLSRRLNTADLAADLRDVRLRQADQCTWRVDQKEPAVTV